MTLPETICRRPQAAFVNERALSKAGDLDIAGQVLLARTAVASSPVLSHRVPSQAT